MSLFQVSQKMINSMNVERSLIITQGNFQLWAIKDQHTNKKNLLDMGERKQAREPTVLVKTMV